MASKNKKGAIRNHIEAITEHGDPTGIVKGVGKSLANDLGVAGGQDFLKFLGIDNTPSGQKSHDNSEAAHNSNEVNLVDFKNKKAESEKIAKAESRTEAAIDYHRDVIKSRERNSHQESRQLTDQVQQILTELKDLINSSQMLKVEFSEITMEKSSTNVGRYQANFFEWMLIMIRQAKVKVEDSQSWLNTAKGKGNKKGYWGMFKKHGTSFGLSNERGVATQVG